MKSIGVARLLLSVVTFSFVVYLIPGMWGAPLKGISGYLPPLETQDVPAVPSPSAAVPDKDAFPKPKHSDFLKLPHGLGLFDLDEAAQYARQVEAPVCRLYGTRLRQLPGNGGQGLVGPAGAATAARRLRDRRAVFR
ncbi:MAG: hypothetical protein ACLTTP_08450 [Alistipes ihumii]